MEKSRSVIDFSRGKNDFQFFLVVHSNICHTIKRFKMAFFDGEAGVTIVETGRYRSG